MTSNNVQSCKGGDRNALKVPVFDDGSRSWSFGLFDCFSDLPTCMCGLRSINYRHLQFPGSLRVGDFRCPVDVLLLLCLFAEQAAN